MRYKEEDIVIPELEKLPNIPPRQWSQEQTETLWKYQNKDLSAVSKHLGKSREACRMKLLELKREREVSE